MEEGTIGFAQFLTMLDLPVSLIGIVIGLSTAVLRPGYYRTNVLAATSLERIGVGLCVAVAALGVFGFGEAIARRSVSPTPLAFLFTVMIFVLAAPGILWRTRWRGVAEGIATIAVSVAAILSGFSIGFLFVPLVILMISVCIRGLLQERVERKSGHPSGVIGVK